MRRALLGQKMEEESSQFRQERQVLFLSIFLNGQTCVFHCRIVFKYQMKLALCFRDVGTIISWNINGISQNSYSQERIRLLHERQAKEVDQFDEESTRLGFR